MVSRKVKCYDHKIGPYDAMKLVVKEDGCYVLLVCDESVEESTVQTPLSSSSILQALNKLADQTWIVCPGVNSYSVYKASIGYDLNRVVMVNFPPNSARDSECTVLYQCTSNKKRCSKCCSLKWQLSRRKREHDKITPCQRACRQSSSSKVPFHVSSPRSKKAKYDNMRMTIRKLQSRAEYYSDKIVRLLTGDVQNKEIGELVNVIATSSCGCQKLREIFLED